MKTVVQDRYGGPEVLRLEDAPAPTPGAGEVLIEVHAASLNKGDWHLMRGSPFLVRLMCGGILSPATRTIGSDVAGRVEAVGDGVRGLRPGDEVFGDLSESGFGGFAEFACAPEGAFVHKPPHVSFERAAATPVAGLAALHAVRDVAEVRAGQRVLVNGASGGVGTFAVQIAKSRGAEVTGVCRGRNGALVASIGAVDVVDREREDAVTRGVRYDVVIDTAAYRSALDYRSILTPDGVYVMVGGALSRLFHLMLLKPWIVARAGGQRFETFMSKPSHDDLLELAELLDSGSVTPVIDSHYPLDEIVDAMTHLESGHPAGKVVIRV